jgi:hypothetical protein
MKHWVSWGSIAGATIGLAGCGSDGGGTSGATGGSCRNDQQCFEVSAPADYNVKSECGFTSSTWSQSKCNPAGYDRKCTQPTQVSINDGPEQTVVYVYYFSPASATGCLGTEEKL